MRKTTKISKKSSATAGTAAAFEVLKPATEAGNAEARAVPTPQMKAHQAQTRVAARMDVGFGNALFIRGHGEGLSWERGTPLQCEEGSRWVWSAGAARDRIVFKLLLNDQVWAQGEDRVVEAGRTIEVVPVF